MGGKHSVLQPESTMETSQSTSDNSQKTTLKDVIKNLPRMNNELYGLLMEKNKHLLPLGPADSDSHDKHLLGPSDGQHAATALKKDIDAKEDSTENQNLTKVEPVSVKSESEDSRTAASSTTDPSSSSMASSAPTKRPSLSAAAAYAPKKRFKQRFQIPDDCEEQSGGKQENGSAAAVTNGSKFPTGSSHGDGIKGEVAEDNASSGRTSEAAEHSVSMRTYMDDMMTQMVKAPLRELEETARIVKTQTSPAKAVAQTGGKLMDDGNEARSVTSGNENSIERTWKSYGQVAGELPRTQGDLIQQRIRDLLREDSDKDDKVNIIQHHADGISRKRNSEEGLPPDLQRDSQLSGVAPLTLISANIEAVMRQQPYNYKSVMKEKSLPTTKPSVSQTSAVNCARGVSSPSLSYPQLRLQLTGGAGVCKPGLPPGMSAGKMPRGSISKGVPSSSAGKPRPKGPDSDSRKSHPDTVYNIVTNEIKQSVYNRPPSSSAGSKTMLHDDRIRSNSWSFNKTRFEPYKNNARSRIVKGHQQQGRNKPAETPSGGHSDDRRLLQTPTSPERPASYHGPPQDPALLWQQKFGEQYMDSQTQYLKDRVEGRIPTSTLHRQQDRMSPRHSTASPHINPHPYPHHPALGVPPGRTATSSAVKVATSSQLSLPPPVATHLEGQQQLMYPVSNEAMARYMMMGGARDGLYPPPPPPEGRQSRDRMDTGRGFYDRQRREDEVKSSNVMFEAPAPERPYSFGSITRGTPRTGPAVSDHQRESILNEAYQIQSAMPPRSHYPHHSYDKALENSKKAPPPLNKAPPPLLPIPEDRPVVKDDYSGRKVGGIGSHLTLPERERPRSRSPMSHSHQPGQGYPSSRSRGNSSEHPLDLSKKESNSTNVTPSPPLLVSHQTNRHPGQKQEEGGRSDGKLSSLEKVYSEPWLKHYKLPPQVEKQIRKEDSGSSNPPFSRSNNPPMSDKDLRDWGSTSYHGNRQHPPSKPYDHLPVEVNDSRQPTPKLQRNPEFRPTNPELLQRNPELMSGSTVDINVATAQAQMMAHAYGNPPFGLLYSIPLPAVNPALYAVHSTELFKPVPVRAPSPGASRNNSPHPLKQQMQDSIRQNSQVKQPLDDLRGRLPEGEDYGDIRSLHRKHPTHPMEHGSRNVILPSKIDHAAMDMGESARKHAYEALEERKGLSVEAGGKNYIDSHGNSVMKCFLCDEEFPTRDWGMFRRHMRSHETLGCLECHVQFRDRNELQLHMSLFHKSHTCVCKVCNVAFEHIDAMYKHVHSVHSNLSNVQVDFCCLHCNASFKNERELSEHRQLHDFQGRGSPGGQVSISVRARVKDQEVSMSPPPNVVHRVTPDTTCKEETRLPSSEPETVISRSDSKPDDTITSYCVSPLSKPMVSSNSRLSPESTVRTNLGGLPPSSLSFFEMLQNKVEYEHHRQAGSESLSRRDDKTWRPSIEGRHDNGKLTSGHQDPKLINHLLKRQAEEQADSGESKRAKIDSNAKFPSGIYTANSIISGIVESAIAESNTADNNSRSSEHMRALMSSLMSLPQQQDIKQLMETMATKSTPLTKEQDINSTTNVAKNLGSGNNHRSPFVSSSKHRSQFTDSDLIAATVLAEISGSIVGGHDAQNNRPKHNRGSTESQVSNSDTPHSGRTSPQTSRTSFHGSNSSVRASPLPPQLEALNSQYRSAESVHDTSDENTQHYDVRDVQSRKSSADSEKQSVVELVQKNGLHVDKFANHGKSSVVVDRQTPELDGFQERSDKNSLSGSQIDNLSATSGSPVTVDTKQEESYSPKCRQLDRMESFDDQPLVIALDEEFEEKNNEKCDSD